MSLRCSHQCCFISVCDKRTLVRTSSFPGCQTQSLQVFGVHHFVLGGDPTCRPNVLIFYIPLTKFETSRFKTNRKLTVSSLHPCRPDSRRNYESFAVCLQGRRNWGDSRVTDRRAQSLKVFVFELKERSLRNRDFQECSIKLSSVLFPFVLRPLLSSSSLFCFSLNSVPTLLLSWGHF